MVDLVVRGDTVVTPDGVGAYDILISGEKIVAMAAKGSLPVPEGARLKVPHMGWNRVRQLPHAGRVHPLWQGISDESWFYFVHSYYARVVNSQHAAGLTVYGAPFTSAIARDNIFATQFHPEKKRGRWFAVVQELRVVESLIVLFDRL